MTNTDRRIGKGLLALAIVPALLLAGCGPSVNKDEKVRQAVFQDPTYTNGEGLTDTYAIDPAFSTQSTTIEFVPLDERTLPAGAENIRFEGNGWYTFLWKGGCYIASAQDSGESDYEVRITAAHNKQACNLSPPERQKKEEYEHYNTQY